MSFKRLMAQASFVKMRLIDPMSFMRKTNVSLICFTQLDQGILFLKEIYVFIQGALENVGVVTIPQWFYD